MEVTAEESPAAFQKKELGRLEKRGRHLQKFAKLKKPPVTCYDKKQPKPHILFVLFKLPKQKENLFL